MKRIIPILFTLLLSISIAHAGYKPKARWIASDIALFGVNISTSADTVQKVMDELNVVVVSSAAYSETSSTATFAESVNYNVLVASASYAPGASTFLGLTDTPAAFDSGKYFKSWTSSGTWETVSGDNLGNHTATQDIDASGYKLSIATITATGTGTFGDLIVDTNVLVVDAANDKVGIGTIAPDSIFHIKANVQGTVGSHPAGQLIIQDPDDTVFGNAVITGYESDGAGNPDQQLWYLGSSSSSNSDIIFLNRRNANLKLGTSGSTRMTILGNGNVGIGTDTPGSKLEVNGTITSGDIDASSYNLSITTITFSDFTILTSTSGLGGGGVSTFLDLTDTPASFDTGKYFKSGTSSGTWETINFDADYLKLDCSNDPLIAGLEIQGNLTLTASFPKIIPAGSGALTIDTVNYLTFDSEIAEFIFSRAGAIGLRLRIYTPWDQALLCVGSPTGRNLLLVADVNSTKDFDKSDETNPTFWIHSAVNPDTDNTQWLNFYHDQTDANIGVGSGDLILTIAGDDLLPSTANHNLGSSSNYWGTLHIATITYHSIPDYQPDLSISEDILRIQPSDKSSYPNSIYREPVDTIKIKQFEKDKIPKDKEKIKYKKIKDLPIECIVKKYDVELSTSTEVTMLLDEVTDEEIIEILPQKSEVEVTYVGNEGLSLEAIISLLIEHNKELEERVRELENK